MAHNQTVSTMELDMDRWIKDRDTLSKKIEDCNNKLAEAKSSEVSFSHDFLFLLRINPF